MNEEAQPADAAEEDIRSPGELLNRGREQRGLSLDDVAVELNLSAQQIRALEQNRYGDLPGKTYVRGYLKAYGRLLGYDEAEVLRNFNLHEDATIRGLRPVVPETGRGRRVARMLGAAALVAALGAIALAWFQSRQAPDAAAPAGGGVQREIGAVAPGDDPVEVRTQTRTPEPTEAVVAAPAAAADAPGLEANLRAMIEAEERARAGDQEATAETPAGSGRVRLEFGASSWVDLRDAEGKRLIYEHVNGGREIEVEGKPPFSVFIGNAGGVQVEYDGKPFDFSKFSNGIYARFDLGGGAL